MMALSVLWSHRTLCTSTSVYELTCPIALITSKLAFFLHPQTTSAKQEARARPIEEPLKSDHDDPSDTEGIMSAIPIAALRCCGPPCASPPCGVGESCC